MASAFNLGLHTLQLVVASVAVNMTRCRRESCAGEDNPPGRIADLMLSGAVFAILGYGVLQYGLRTANKMVHMGGLGATVLGIILSFVSMVKVLLFLNDEERMDTPDFFPILGTFVFVYMALQACAVLLTVGRILEIKPTPASEPTA